MSTLIDLVTDLISIPSVAGDRDSCDEALTYLLEIGRDLGFRCQRKAGGRLGVIEMGEGEETVGLLTHVDVAHPGNWKNWTNPPFEPVVEKGILYGRGAVDNKAPAVAALAAMQGIRSIQEKYRLQMTKKIRMIISTCQETGGDDVKEYILDQGAPDYSFALDGIFPVGNSCKGTVQILFSFPLDGKSRVIADIIAGNNPMTVPESCRITLSDRRIFGAKGTASHISNVDPQENAILKLTRSLDQLKGRDRRLLRGDPVYRVLQKLEEGFSDPCGRHADIPQGNALYKNELTGTHTFTPTSMFLSDGRLYVTISGTHSTDISPDRIIRRLEGFFDSERGRVEQAESGPARFIDHGKPYVKSLLEAYHHISEKKAEPSICPYDSMIQLVPNAVSYGPLAGNVKDTRHCANEQLPVATFLRLPVYYERALSGFVFYNQSFK